MQRPQEQRCLNCPVSKRRDGYFALFCRNSVGDTNQCCSTQQPGKSSIEVKPPRSPLPIYAVRNAQVGAACRSSSSIVLYWKRAWEIGSGMNQRQGRHMTMAAELYSWQKENHGELRTAHLHTLKREALVAMRSPQKGAQFLRARCPFDRGTISLCVYIYIYRYEWKCVN